jgi:peptidoglycan-associated lipoprotein
MMRRLSHLVGVAAVLLLVANCTAKKPPVPVAPPPATPNAFPAAGNSAPPPPPTAPPVPPNIADEPVVTSKTANLNDMPLETLNGPSSPLKPVFFAYDNDELDDGARQILNADAEVLKAYPNWIITIEGHCDERGTAEYNLALGDRRSLAAKTYLLSLGVPAARLRTVSYGKEFPFDKGHDEPAWSKNRRAQLMVTSKQ